MLYGEYMLFRESHKRGTWNGRNSRLDAGLEGSEAKAKVFNATLLAVFCVLVSWGLAAVRGALSDGGAEVSHCGGFPCCGADASAAAAHRLQSGLSGLAHRPSCFLACEILPDQEWNLCPLH